MHACVQYEEENGARETEKGEKREHVVVIWLFYCLALVVKVLGRGYTRSGSCQKPPESGYPDRPYTDREYSVGVVGGGVNRKVKDGKVRWWTCQGRLLPFLKT